MFCSDETRVHQLGYGCLIQVCLAGEYWYLQVIIMISFLSMWQTKVLSCLVLTAQPDQSLMSFHHLAFITKFTYKQTIIKKLYLYYMYVNPLIVHSKIFIKYICKFYRKVYSMFITVCYCLNAPYLTYANFLVSA